VSSAQVEAIAASYSTKVAGKSYSASVEESGGTYVASTPNPPDISASGSSIASAESNLDMKLDTLA
jgi:predicted RNase H-like HicB family nuclease